MRDRHLKHALNVFARQASRALIEATQAGAEVPFEILEEPGGTSVLYRYRPQTDAFIDAERETLRALEAFGPAVDALAATGGVPGYLRICGEDPAPGTARERAEAEAMCLLRRIWDDDSSFAFDEAGFERHAGELVQAAGNDELGLNVVAPLAGLRPIGQPIELGDGLTLADGDTVDAPAQAVWDGRSRQDREPHVLAVMSLEQDADAPLPAAGARLRLRRLLTALRLFKEGSVAGGPVAYARGATGPWQPLAIGFAGAHARAGYWLEPAELEEFRAFHGEIQRKLDRDTHAWPLARFEMGCERPTAIEGLTDHLLALRALCDRDGIDSAGLPLRVAALAAEVRDRAHVAERVEQSLALERQLIRGFADAEGVAELGIESPDAICIEVEEHLRAILREVLTGGLGADLKREAEQRLLSESAGGDRAGSPKPGAAEVAA